MVELVQIVFNSKALRRGADQCNDVMGKDAGCEKCTSTHAYILFYIHIQHMEDTKATGHSVFRLLGSGDDVSRLLFLPATSCPIISSNRRLVLSTTKAIACVSNVRLCTPHPVMKGLSCRVKSLWSDAIWGIIEPSNKAGALWPIYPNLSLPVWRAQLDEMWQS